MKPRRLARLGAAAALGLAAVAGPAPSATAVQTQRVANGGFESADAQWTLGNSVVCPASLCARSAASGSWFAASAYGFDQAPAQTNGYALGVLEQKVYLPETPAVLTFRARTVDSAAVGVGSYLVVKVGGTTVEVFGEPAVGSFQSFSYTLPDSLTDTMFAQPLRFEFYCDNLTDATSDCDTIDVDSVSLVTGTDTEPPQTRITSGPSSPTTARLATFKFTSSETGSTFRCRLDDESWVACTAPYERRVSLGKHVFKVKAKDAAGNVDPTPATWSWKRVAG